MLKPENIQFLRQLILSLEKAEEKLDEAYRSESFDNFNRIKKFILQIQKKISEALE